MQLNAPDIIVRNEKRMLQEAVDALIDNGRRGRAVTGANSRALKSLSDMLKGKQGRFRQNLLGKRVDYSGRSVIVVGPDLKIYQCGVPKEMAIELFRPFVMKKLVEDGVANNIKSAKKMVDKQRTEVWDALEYVIKEHPVLLNRAPTLHRLGIQAFEPILVEGRALQPAPAGLHRVQRRLRRRPDGYPRPPVRRGPGRGTHADALRQQPPASAGRPPCHRSYSGHDPRFLLPDHDAHRQGREGRRARWSSTIRATPASRASSIVDGDEIYAANNKAKAEGTEPCTYKSKLIYRDAERGHHGLQRRRRRPARSHPPPRHQDRGRRREERHNHHHRRPHHLSTSLSRRISATSTAADPEHAFDHEISFQVGKKQLGDIIDRCIQKYGFTISAEVLDSIKALGYKYSTKGAITISVADMTVPSAKKELIHETEEEVVKIERQYKRGFITDDERYRLVVSEWEKTTKEVTDALQSCLDEYNPIYMMANSGARGSMNQIRQLAGMRGLMANTAGKTIEIPIKSNFREGLSVLEYFISTRGARKGMADTALRTADSGYLTRRMVDVCQDVIIRENDCGTTEGVWAAAQYDRGQMVESFGTAIHGRFPAVDIVDPQTGELLFARDHMLMPEDAGVLEAHGIHKAYIRSVLTCEALTGVCAKCYGINLALGKPVNAGEAVGVIAAQSIGEPGTQLTMRTFHTGGVAGDDITQGLPRVEELFEARKPKKMAILSEISGTVTIDEAKKGVMYSLTVTNEAEGATVVYTVPHSAGILVHNGDHVDKGQELTSGALNPHDVLHIRGVNDDEFGRMGVRSYITSEVQKVYRQQGVDINDKHIEVIVRQMMRKVRVEDAGSTNLLSGATVDISAIKAANKLVDERIAAGEEGLTHATYTQLLMGITKASLATESFLSAASFQETTKVLTDAAIKGKVDHLVGLKENVIIGKLIPAGSGLAQYRDFEMETDDNIASEPEEYVDLSALVNKSNAL